MEQLTPAQEARNARAQRRQFIKERMKRYIYLATGGDELEITDDLRKRAFHEATQLANRIYGTEEQINMELSVSVLTMKEITAQQRENDVDSLE